MPTSGVLGMRSIGKVAVGVGRFLVYMGGDRETSMSRKGREDSNSSSSINWMCLQTEFKC